MLYHLSLILRLKVFYHKWGNNLISFLQNQILLTFTPGMAGHHILSHASYLSCALNDVAATVGTVPSSMRSSPGHYAGCS
jgi:hypothetical protein